MIKTLCIGNASYDNNILMDEFIKEGANLWFDNKNGCGGGTAANIAYSLAKWGVDTTFAGVVGNDVNGNRIKGEFSEVKIDVRFIEMSFEKDTMLNVNLINKSNGEATTIALADEFSKLKKYDYDFNPDLIVSDGYDCYATKSAISRFPKALTLLRPKFATSEVLDLIKFMKHVICPLSVAEKISGAKVDFNNMSTLATLYYKFKAKVQHAQIVITLGEHGALYSVDGEIKISPAIKTAVVDTNGAGDVFAAAYAYVITAGGDFEKAIKYGNIAASLSVSELGIRKSIPSMDQIEKLYVQNYE